MPSILSIGAFRRGVRPAAVILLGAGVCAGVAIALGAAKPAEPSSASPERPARTNNPEEADLVAAAIQGFDVTTSATGELEARRQIDVRNQLEQPTTIVEIIREGVQVKAGEVLVRLNSDNIQTSVDEESLKVESARADVVVAENNYNIQVNQNESDIRKARLDIEVAELDYLKWLEGDVKSKQQANQLAYERAVRELDRLKEKYERSVELEKKGFLASDELKRDEVAYLEAQAALKTAELNTRVYNEFEFLKDEKVKKSAVDQAKADLEKVRQKAEGELAKADADRKNKREQLRLREQKLEKLREQLTLATLRAPSDGLVVYATSVNRDRWGGNADGTLDVGRQVTRNQQLIILPDTSEMVASVRVHESMTGRMRKGQQATVKVDALGGRSIPGTVDSIGVIAESGGWRDPNLREYTIKIKLDTSGLGPSEAQLKPSMRAEATVYLDKVESALTVPLQAVFSEGLVRYVLVPDRANRFKKVAVRLGRRSDRFAEVLAGISEGDRVLVREPTPGEVIDVPWDKKVLAGVGLNLLPDGRIVPLAGAAGAGGGGGAGMGKPASGGPPAGGAGSGVGGGVGGGPRATPSEPAVTPTKSK